MPKKLIAKSRPVVLLREKLHSGNLTGKKPPSSLQAMSLAFSSYRDDNFRRANNEIRNALGMDFGKALCKRTLSCFHLNCAFMQLTPNFYIILKAVEGRGDEALNGRCSNVSSDHTAKKQRLSQDFGDETDDYDDLEERDNKKRSDHVLSSRDM